MSSQDRTVEMGRVTVPSGRLVLVDASLLGLDSDVLAPQQIVVEDLPTSTALRVVGTRPPESEDGWHLDSWDHIDVEIYADATVTRSEPLGRVTVDGARILIADAAACGEWEHEESSDGLADLVFWGLHGPDLAKIVRAPAVDGEDGVFGWRDLDVEDARRRAAIIEQHRRENELRAAVDYRPHSDHWVALESARRSEIDAGVFELHGTRACLALLMGDGHYPVHRRLDAAGRTVAVRIDIEAAFDE